MPCHAGRNATSETVTNRRPYRQCVHNSHGSGILRWFRTIYIAVGVAIKTKLRIEVLVSIGLLLDIQYYIIVASYRHIDYNMGVAEERGQLRHNTGVLALHPIGRGVDFTLRQLLGKQSKHILL